MALSELSIPNPATPNTAIPSPATPNTATPNTVAPNTVAPNTVAPSLAIPNPVTTPSAAVQGGAPAAVTAVPVELIAATPPAAVHVAPAAVTVIAPTVATPNGAARPALFGRQLFVLVTVLLAFQLMMLVGNLWFQFHNYAIGIALAQKGGSATDAVSMILIYSRAWDFAVTKTSALFLGFMVIYTGALYVLHSADTSYEVSFSHGAQPGATLKSSSPGLVLVTLGSALVAMVLYSKSEVGLQVSSAPATPDGAATTLTATTATTASPPAASTNSAAVPPARPAAPAHPAAAPPEDQRMPKLLDPH